MAITATKHPSLDLLRKCKKLVQLNQIHGQLITTGLINNPSAATKLVSIFSSSSNLLLRNARTAQLIADRIEGPHAYTWNTVIRGLLEEKNPREAILVYAHVRRKGLEIDSYTLLFVIKACGLISGWSEGGVIHGQILKMGFETELITQTALLNMYGLFEDLESAHKVFDGIPYRDLVLWNSLITTYAQSKHPYEAISVFRAMSNENLRPNEVTAVTILSTCSFLWASKEGRSVHGYVIKFLEGPDLFVYNGLIDMYAKCGCLLNARRVFEKMPRRNVVSWTSMINGYSQNNYPDEALALFREMESANLRPDEITLLGVVSTCTKLGRIELGKWVDHYVEINGFVDSVSLANGLMDMFAKCGNIKKACWIFDRMVEKTLISWTIMIQGLAMHGHGVAALVRFSQMQREGLRPDGIVFLSVLGACSHTGLVDEGRQCFRSMIEDHGMAPWMEHYGCMVDLFCRAGMVDEAFKFVKSMPVKPDVIVWRTLLGACKNHGNIELARCVMDQLLESEPKYCGNYILMSNLYAEIGEWDCVREVWNQMGVRGVSKSDPAYSSIEVYSENMQ